MIICLFIFIFGIVWGSFYNVVVYRIPKNLPLVNDRSKCPTCNHTLQALDLVPVFSWIFLGQKCRYCKEKISWRYPLFELLTGFVFVGAYFYVTNVLGYNFNRSNEFLEGILQIIIYCSFFSMLYLTTIMDFEYMIVSLNVLGVTFAIQLIGFIVLYYPNLPNLKSHFVGLILGALIYLVIYLVSKAIYKQEAFGQGDVYLLAAIGFVVGRNHVIMIAMMSFFVALILVGIAAVLGKKFEMRKEVPFGPAMCITTIIIMIWGERILNLLGYH